MYINIKYMNQKTQEYLSYHQFTGSLCFWNDLRLHTNNELRGSISWTQRLCCVGLPDSTIHMTVGECWPRGRLWMEICELARNWLNRSVPVHEAHGWLVKALGESWFVSHNNVRISSETCDDVRIWCDMWHVRVDPAVAIQSSSVDNLGLIVQSPVSRADNI